jgi:hypothetical protein
MKRKVVNPDPQEKKIQQAEKKFYNMEMKEEEFSSEELMLHKEKEIKNKGKVKYKGKI